MTALAISSIHPIVKTEIESNQSLPISLRAAKYLSIGSALSATAIMIYGIAVNLMPLIAMGATCLAASFTSFYLIHQMADLRTIEEESKEITALNNDLAKKEGQIKQLTDQIQAISKKFDRLYQEYERLTAADNSIQKKLNQQLERSAEMLEAAETNAQKKLQQFQAAMNDRMQTLQKQSELDQKTIADLNQTLAKASDQNNQLHASLIDLQKQVGTYQQQVQSYSRLNDQLKQQIQTMSQAIKSPAADISSINAHATKIEDAIARQNAAAEKAAKLAAQINASFDALNKKLPKPKPSA